MAPQQSAKFRTAFFGQFRVCFRKDSDTNYASIWALFSMSVTGPDVHCNALNISQIRLYMAPQDSKIAVEILQSVNNRTQSLRKILHVVITDIVINTLLGRVTRHPASMHCPARDDAFVSSLFFCLSRSKSGAPCVRGVHSSHSSLGGATIFTKLRSKIAKSPKIGGKVCVHHFVQIAEEFEKILLQ